MPEQFPHGPDVVTRLEQMPCEAVPGGMTGDPLGDAGDACCVQKCGPKNQLVQMMPPSLARHRVHGFSRRGGEPLELQSAARLRTELAADHVGTNSLAVGLILAVPDGQLAAL